MKITIAAVVILAFATIVSVQAENMMAKVRECKQKTNCKENVLQIVRSNGEPQSEECYCALGCIGKETGILTATNGLDKEKVKMILAKMQIPADKVDIIAEKCKSESAANECEAAKTMMKCIKEQTQ